MEEDRGKTEDLAGQQNSSEPEQNQDKNETDLLSLPPEVLEMVLDYLDAPALLNLRLTSKRTKAVVEQEKYLEKIPVYMKPMEICSVLRQVNASSIPWTNFKFDVGLITTTCFPRFANKYGPNMKVCCLYGQEDQNRIRKFLCKLTSLHTFEIRNVPLSWYFYGISHAQRNSFDVKTMKENLERVQVFRISLDFYSFNILYNRGSLDFLLYLKHSSNLRIVELKHDPRFPDDSSDDDDEDDDEANISPINYSLFQPLLRFLVFRQPEEGDPKYLLYDETEDDESPPMNLGPLDIYFQGVENIDSTGRKFEKSRRVFLEIVEKCHGTNVKLHNVPCYLLPLDTHELSDVQRLKLDSCVISLCGDLAAFRLRQNIYVPVKFGQSQ